MTALYETALSKRRIRSICKQKKDRVIEKKLDRTYRYVVIRERERERHLPLLAAQVGQMCAVVKCCVVSSESRTSHTHTHTRSGQNGVTLRCKRAYIVVRQAESARKLRKGGGEKGRGVATGDSENIRIRIK